MTEKEKPKLAVTPDGGMTYDPREMHVEYVVCTDGDSCDMGIPNPHAHSFYRITLLD